MPDFPESWMVTAAAEDALANAVEAGWKFTICDNCGGEGYWAREDKAWPCPLCDAPLVYPRVPAATNDDGIEIDDRRCPFCAHSWTYWQECTAIGCDEGFDDEYDEDPINCSPGTYRQCSVCHGQGHMRWCPNCGQDILDGMRNYDECPACGETTVPHGNGSQFHCENCGTEWGDRRFR